MMISKASLIVNQKGFSLTELMTVVAIIGILAAVAIPSYQKYVRRSKQTEAKLLLGGFYASSIAFNAEWGYSTTNFIQMGFSPQGDLNYNIGFGAHGTLDPATYDDTLSTPPTGLEDYDGPPVPKDGYSGDTKTFIETKVFCPDSDFGSSCNYLPTKTITIPNGAKVDNSEKYSPNFKVMAIGDLGGSEFDEWELNVDDGGKVITNNKSGL